MIAITNKAMNMQKPLLTENQGLSFLLRKQIGTIMQEHYFFFKLKKGSSEHPDIILVCQMRRNQG